MCYHRKKPQVNGPKPHPLCGYTLHTTSVSRPRGASDVAPIVASRHRCASAGRPARARARRSARCVAGPTRRNRRGTRRRALAGRQAELQALHPVDSPGRSRRCPARPRAEVFFLKFQPCRVQPLLCLRGHAPTLRRTRLRPATVRCSRAKSAVGEYQARRHRPTAPARHTSRTSDPAPTETATETIAPGSGKPARL